MTELTDGAVLRPARPDDVPGILGLIRELADYERMPEAVENTEDALRETLFGAAPAAYCHIVERRADPDLDLNLDLDPKDAAAGGPSEPPRVLAIALWFLNYSTWVGRHGIYLEDLIVTQRERGKGYGVALMRELAAICVERGYGRFEWSVLDWNEPSIRFYRSIGAIGMDGWSLQRLTGDALTRLGTR